MAFKQKRGTNPFSSVTVNPDDGFDDVDGTPDSEGYGRGSLTWNAYSEYLGFRTYQELFQSHNYEIESHGSKLDDINYANDTGVESNATNDFNQNFPEFLNPALGSVFRGALSMGSGRIAIAHHVSTGTLGIQVRLADIYDIYQKSATLGTGWWDKPWRMREPVTFYPKDSGGANLSSNGSGTTSIGDDCILVGSTGDVSTAVLRLNGTQVDTGTALEPLTNASTFQGYYGDVGCGVIAITNYPADRVDLYKRDKSSTSTSTTTWERFKTLQPFSSSILNRFGSIARIGHGRIAVIEDGTNSTSAYRKLWIFDLQGNLIRVVSPTNEGGWGNDVCIGSGFIFVGHEGEDVAHEDGGGKSTIQPANRGRVWVYSLDGKFVCNYYGTLPDQDPDPVELPHNMSSKYGYLAMSYSDGVNPDADMSVAYVTAGVNGILEVYNHTNSDFISSYNTTNYSRTTTTGHPSEDYVSDFYSSTSEYAGMGVNVGVNADAYAGYASQDIWAYDNAATNDREVVAMGDKRILSLNSQGAGGTTTGIAQFQVPSKLANYYEDKATRRSFRKSYWGR